MNQTIRQFLQAAGRKGGVARREALTPERRTEIAKQGAQAAAAARRHKEKA